MDVLEWRLDLKASFRLSLLSLLPFTGVDCGVLGEDEPRGETRFVEEPDDLIDLLVLDFEGGVEEDMETVSVSRMK